MKTNFYKKLLSIILTAMLILATIPFSCISVLAEEAGVPVLYASQISNNTHLTLDSDTELIMDTELHIKLIPAKTVIMMLIGQIKSGTMLKTVFPGGM